VGRGLGRKRDEHAIVVVDEEWRVTCSASLRRVAMDALTRLLRE
jgi:hypothetical protein